MPLRRGTPLTFTPSGASDAVDGSTAPPGAMRALTNWIPDPSTRGVWGPRPASRLEADNIADQRGVANALLVVGDLAYGMVPSATHPGKDAPFLYNLALGGFTTIVGTTNQNLPASPPAAGDWTPPIMAQIGGRIIVTHPGFPGDRVKFGWIDISSAMTTIVGDVGNGSAFITGFYSLLGIEPGMKIAGANIPASAAVLQTYENAVVGFQSTGTVTDGSTVANINDMTGFHPGSLLYGLGIAPGTVILSRSGVVGAGTIVMSSAATASGAALIAAVLPASAALNITTTAGSPNATYTPDGGGSTAVYFAVGQEIINANIPAGTTVTAADAAGNVTLSQNATGNGTAFPTIAGEVILMNVVATGSANGEAITISGGTPSAPLWGAGDCDRNPLLSVPLGVAQMNGRAWFADGNDGIPFSDPLQPCRRTNASQALTTNDGLPVTAVAPLLLNAPITGGIVQALIAFQGSNQMRQITGDPVTSNLAMNLLPVATGTDAPLSIVPTEKGLAFISPDGLRFIDFAGNVSVPIGDFGAGIVVPFHEALYPSRICGAAASSVLRFTVQNGAVADAPFQEWWYDLSLQKWHGPHTFPAALIQRWRSKCLLAPVGIPGQLWSSTVVPAANDSYVENGQVLTCIAETVLLPDSGLMAMNAMIQATLACSGARQINYQVLDEDDNPLDFVGVPISDVGAFRQRPIYFHQPIVFKQMRVIVTAQADQTLRLGNFYWRYQILGWTAQADLPAPGAFL